MQGSEAEIITITRNRPLLLLQFIKRIRELEPSVPLLIIDNASTPTCKGFVANQIHNIPRVRFLSLRRNIFSLARNIGGRMTQSKVLFFLDDDVCPLTPFVERTLRLFDQDQALALVAFDVFDVHSKRMLTSRLQENPITFHDAAFAVRKRIWDETGGFQKQYPARGLVADFSIRLLSQGYRIHHDKKTVFLHLGKRRLGGTRLHRLWKLPALFGFTLKYFNIGTSLRFCLQAALGVCVISFIEGWLEEYTVSLILALKSALRALAEKSAAPTQVQNLYKQGKEIRVMCAPFLENIKKVLSKLL
ncbi:MAG: hypothetical protein DRP63_01235 [Planctomycetota bacterium]|nr:MAG: hypothetical protein DRP63_01235 [Planctomycetota bacterium]